MQHRRRLDEAGMDAVARFGLRDEPGGIAHAHPAGGEAEHVGLDPQRASGDLEDRDIAAMGVEEDEPADAGARHALAGLDQHGLQRRRVERQHARKGEVLVGFRHRDGRQEKDLRILHGGGRAQRHRFGEDGVCRQRQMGAVLLDGADRQQGDGGIRHQRLQIVSLQVAPVPKSHHKSDYRPRVRSSWQQRVGRSSRDLAELTSGGMGVL